jgi:carotenoid cleavage dioxygenase-like enzyme
MRSGTKTSFHFGKDYYVGEPVYVPNPAFAPTDEEHGWIIAEALDGQKRKSFMAVFEAANLEKGPIAKLWLEHHLPMSFHGSWQPELGGRSASHQGAAAASR